MMMVWCDYLYMPSHYTYFSVELFFPLPVSTQRETIQFVVATALEMWNVMWCDMLHFFVAAISFSLCFFFASLSTNWKCLSVFATPSDHDNIIISVNVSLVAHHLSSLSFWVKVFGKSTFSTFILYYRKVYAVHFVFYRLFPSNMVSSCFMLQYVYGL